jgi:hypothetical protein
MSQSRADRFSLKYALGLSTVLHVLLAPFFVVSAALLIGAGHSLQAAGLPGDDQASVSTITIEQRAQRSVARRTAPAKTTLATTVKRALPLPLPKSPIAAANTNTRAQAFVRAATREARTIARAGGVALDKVRDFVASRPAVAATIEPQQASAIAAPAAPMSAPTAAIVLASAVQPASGRDGPNGGWGQNFEKPLLADESALTDLRTKYHASATISVIVDENGRAVRIVVPDFLSSDARSEIEKRLNSLRYVPAECNGLRCQGTLQLII